MTIGITGNLEATLKALGSVKENWSVIKPDGTTLGYMTEPVGINFDGSIRFWFGIRREGEIFKFDVPESQIFDVHAGDQLLFQFNTEEETKAFLLGILLGCTKRDFGLS